MAIQSPTVENKELARRFFEEVLSEKNFDKIDDLFAETYTHHDAESGRELHGRREFRKLLTKFTTAFPDVKMTIHDQLADDDHVVTRLTMTGTQTGPFGELEATGKSVSIEGIVEHRIKNGKIVEGFPQWDMLGLMRQVGAIPDQPAD
ncbi:ester cyclase [Haladaptatus sp. DJG-WS-42]|uniref:ester cyclase n=1 Tax=Haladaptatus sp. DJG-WS-42 TaxID=3120516 RepID=UPI0030D3C6F4